MLHILRIGVKILFMKTNRVQPVISKFLAGHIKYACLASAEIARVYSCFYFINKNLLTSKLKQAPITIRPIISITWTLVSFLESPQYRLMSSILTKEIRPVKAIMVSPSSKLTKS
jgi:hypothetical protein